MTPPDWIEILRLAEVEWTSGMLPVRVSWMKANGEPLPDYLQCGPRLPTTLEPLPMQIARCQKDSVPDLRDMATRSLVLAQLGVRVGLDAFTVGVCWVQQHDMWYLTTTEGVPIGTQPEGFPKTTSVHFYDPLKSRPIGFARLFQADGISTSDPLLALALACRATADFAMAVKA